MIKERTPLTLAEVSDLVGEGEKADKIKGFIKKLSVKPLNVKKAREMREELKGLELLKLKEEHIVKIVDFMPESNAELSKVVSEVSLDQDEVNKILDVVKKY